MNYPASRITVSYPRLSSLSVRQLHALAVLGEQRNIHRAAALMNISQPAMSKLLSDLERRIETQLFVRGPRGADPTVAGEVLIRHARMILGEVKRASEDLTEVAKGRPETLRIGTLQSSAATLVPRALQRLRSEMPRLSVSIREGTITTLVEQLACAKIDVVVGRIGYRPKGNQFEERYLDQEHPRIVARPGHPLAGRRKVTWEDLHRFEWILPAPGTPLRERVEMLLAETRTPVRDRVCESGSMICSLALLAASDMVMPLPDGLARYYAALGQTATLPILLPEMFGPIGALWRRTEPESEARARFVSLLAECAEEMRAPSRKRRVSATS
jgi:DNA-binding transcriptional LysR family regulator